MQTTKLVTILSSPITERYVRLGMLGKLDTETKKIQVNDAWFNFDDRWVVTEAKTTEQIKEELFKRVSNSISAWTESDYDEYIADTDSLTIQRHCTLSNSILTADNKLKLILSIEKAHIDKTDLQTLSEVYEQYPSLEWIKGLDNVQNNNF
jgi:hypothetical protein